MPDMVINTKKRWVAVSCRQIDSEVTSQNHWTWNIQLVGPNSSISSLAEISVTGQTFNRF